MTQYPIFYAFIDSKKLNSEHYF